MTVHNPWGTPLDPKTGLPGFPLSGPAQSTSTRLKARAKAARAAREQLQTRLDRLTAEFQSAYAEADQRDLTQQRIAAAARANRKN